MNRLNSENQLKVFLWLITIHSFVVGTALIFLPAENLEFFGFHNYKASFFQAQGGVFHIVMSVAYVLTAKYVDRSPDLIYFVILAKGMATVFLLTYSLIAESNWMLILSACADAAMALITYILYLQYLKSKTRLTND